jgi:AraC-like DNA-binding protein
MNPAIRFSTDDLPPRDRLTIWREVLCQSRIGAEVEPTSAAPFRAHVTARELAGLRLLAGWSTAANYQGTAPQGDGDDLLLTFGNTPVSTRLNQREALIESGDAFVLPRGDRGSIRLPQDGGFTIVRLPRAAVAASAVNLEDSYCRCIPDATPALRLLKGYVAMLQHDDGTLTAPDLQHAAAAHVCDLVAVTLGATRDGAESARQRGVRAARLAAMKGEVVRHLKDQALSVTAVAARHAVTPRYVQRLFAETGIGFTEYVVAQRLARAHRLVSDPQLAGRTLTALAHEAGFGDLSYFNRAFRRQFGAAPAEVRAQALSSE